MPLQCQPLQRLFLPTLLLVTFALHLQLIDRFPLREDEALYSYWARSLRHEDFLMRTVWPDKPPLFLWAQAAMFEFIGPSQASARLLNLGLSTLTVAVVAATGRRLWGVPAGNLSALLLALNPFAISFAATAYTDPLLVFCGQLALYLALSGRAVGAGIWLAAAIMTKQQGLLYLPLVLMALLWAAPPYPSSLHNRRQNRQGTFSPNDTQAPTERIGVGQSVRHKVTYTLQWCIGLALLLLPILYWDSLRWRVAPSPWDLSIRNYAPLTWVPPSQWWERVRGWGDLLWYFGGNHWVWIGYGLLLLCSIRVGRWRRPARAVVLLLGWSGGYLLLHVVTTIHIWDRYLLPLVPMMALLMAAFVPQSLPAVHVRGVPPPKLTRDTARVDRKRYTGWTRGFAIAITVLLLPTAFNAAHGSMPIGGDRGSYSGLVEATQWIRTQNAPFVLYHQRLGWHYRFYLFDEWQNEQADLRWFPNAVYLADNAAKLPYRRRFYLQPPWHPVPNLRLHLTTRNMQLIERAHFGEMRLYEIINRPQPPCSWCRCAPAATAWWSHVTTPGERLLSPATDP